MLLTRSSRAAVALLSSAVLGGCLLVACLGEDPKPSGPSSATPGSALDAGTPPTDSGGAPPDAGVAAPGCDLDAPFGEPTLVAGVNTSAPESKPALSADERTLYFVAPAGRAPLPAGSSDYDVFVTVRPSLSDPFGLAEVVSVTRSEYFDSDPFLSDDGTVLIFSTRAPSNGPATITFARRAGLNAPFGTAAPVSGLRADVDAGAHQGQPALTAAGRQLWFASARPVDGGTSNGLFWATFDPMTGAATDKRAASSLTSDHDDLSPTLSVDGRRVFFASRRPVSDGGAASERLNVWTATRASTSVEFASPSLVPELTSATADTSPRWLSHDGCRLYLTRSPGPAGADDILVAERPRR